MARSLEVTREDWPLRGTFRISRGARTSSQVIVAAISEDGTTGRGECFPYAHYGETSDSVDAQIRSAAGAIASGTGRQEIQTLLPPGAARNALDCALWDLEARRSGRRAWELAGLAEPGPVTTVYTLGVDTPDAMASAARRNAERPLLKLKLAGDGADIARLEAIHAAVPSTRLVVDVNEGWSVDDYLATAPLLPALGVEMIEQPLPAAGDHALAGLERPVPVCADESCHVSGDIGVLAERYDLVNIKLDKTGGLTEALLLAEAARRSGLGIMVGCMIGTSLAMAPAVLVAQGAAVVDLDGPLLLARDREPGLEYDASLVHPPSARLWG